MEKKGKGKWEEQKGEKGKGKGGGASNFKFLAKLLHNFAFDKEMAKNYGIAYFLPTLCSIHYLVRKINCNFVRKRAPPCLSFFDCTLCPEKSSTLDIVQ